MAVQNHKSHFLAAHSPQTIAHSPQTPLRFGPGICIPTIARYDRSFLNDKLLPPQRFFPDRPPWLRALPPNGDMKN